MLEFLMIYYHTLRCTFAKYFKKIIKDFGDIKKFSTITQDQAKVFKSVKFKNVNKHKNLFKLLMELTLSHIRILIIIS